MDLTHAVRRELAAVPAVMALLGSDATYADGWLFQWLPKREVEGTGEASMVISSRNGWSTANRHNTAQFPRLQIEIYQDTARHPDRNPLNQTAQEKARIVFDAADKILHVPAPRPTTWGNPGGIRIVSSLRSTEPETVEVPDGDGVVRLTAHYDVTLG